MAILDARLLPLIETLTLADLDWLAFEILDALKLGRVAEETRETLERTRKAVRSYERQEQRLHPRASPPSPSTPILGDDQISWAADYVINRISDAVSMLQATLDHLDTITGTAALDRPPSASAPRVGVSLVLRTNDEEISVTRSAADVAKNATPKLQEALRAWVVFTQKGGLRE